MAFHASLKQSAKGSLAEEITSASYKRFVDGELSRQRVGRGNSECRLRRAYLEKCLEPGAYQDGAEGIHAKESGISFESPKT